MDRYNPHKQKIFGIINTFKTVRGLSKVLTNAQTKIKEKKNKLKNSRDKTLILALNLRENPRIIKIRTLSFSKSKISKMPIIFIITYFDLTCKLF